MYNYDSCQLNEPPALQAVVVGAGYIGLEVGAALAMNGLEVTLVMPSDRFMPRLFTKELAAFYEKFYTDKGIKIVRNEKVTGFEGSGKVRLILIQSSARHWLHVVLHASLQMDLV